jgi:hypothetical protein
MRVIGAIAAVFCFICLFNAAVSAFDFGRGSQAYAENVCPQPPNGVSSVEQQTCLDAYEAMTPLDVAGKALLLAAASFMVAVVGLALSKEPVPEMQARPDR